MYLTYDEYIGMGGELSDADFLTLAEQAEAIVDCRTYGRLCGAETVSGRVKRCVFVLVNILNDKKQYTSDGRGAVTGESNDGVSVSYAAVDAKTAAELYDAEIKTCIRTYLGRERAEDGTPLLYRGVDCGT